MNRFFVFLALVASFPAAAIDCIRSDTPVTPVIVLEKVDVGFQGVDVDQLRKAIKDRLLEGGKYRVALPDQYRFALQNHKIDRCTPTLGVAISIEMEASDPGAAYGLGGFVKRLEFTTKASIELLPDEVSVDSVVLSDKTDGMLSSKKAQDVLARLVERLIQEFENKRDAWTRSDSPGF